MKTFAYLLWALAGLVAVAWLIEACTIGRGFISTYLAPVAFIGLPVSTILAARAHHQVRLKNPAETPRKTP